VLKPSDVPSRRSAEWITEYQFTSNREMHGIEFIDAGVRVGVHGSGQLSACAHGRADPAQRRAESGEADAAGREGGVRFEGLIPHGYGNTEALANKAFSAQVSSS
jgi:hypothetical protein